MTPKRKRIIIAAVAVLAVAIIAMALHPKLYGVFFAPKFDSLEYQHVGYISIGWCLPACAYDPVYTYRGSGSQADMVAEITRAMKSKGYAPNLPDEGLYIECGNPTDIDEYTYSLLDKPSDGRDEFFIVSFKPADANTNSLTYLENTSPGCERPPMEYVVEIRDLSTPTSGLPLFFDRYNYTDSLSS